MVTISSNFFCIFKMPPQQLWVSLKMWFSNWIYSAINYLNEQQQVRGDRVMSSQEIKARSLLWSNNSQSTGPSCDFSQGSAKKARSRRYSYLSPANSVRNNLRPRRSCSKINRPSSRNPKSPEWLPYQKTARMLD